MESTSKKQIAFAVLFYGMLLFKVVLSVKYNTGIIDKKNVVFKY